MSTALQILIGVSLGACSGLRACLPLLMMGLLARNGYMPINPALAMLTHTDTLIVLGIASVLEFLGDKVVVIDHALDAIGTVARPIAGTLLATATLTHLDPKLALLLGLIVGGGTALTVHAGKASTRVKSTAFAHFHAGTGNLALSLLEDIVVGVLLWTSVHAPVVGFCLALCLILTAVLMIALAIKTGKKVVGFVRSRRIRVPQSS